MLPLSVAAALLLFLASLALQTAVLHGRRQFLSERHRLAADDQLASAAHQWVDHLLSSDPCLLSLASSIWADRSGAPTCSSSGDPALLEQASPSGVPVLLRSWIPDAGGGELRLQLGTAGPQRRFRLDLAPARGLQEFS